MPCFESVRLTKLRGQRSSFSASENLNWHQEEQMWRGHNATLVGSTCWQYVLCGRSRRWFCGTSGSCSPSTDGPYGCLVKQSMLFANTCRSYTMPPSPITLFWVQDLNTHCPKWTSVKMKRKPSSVTIWLQWALCFSPAILTYQETNEMFCLLQSYSFKSSWEEMCF